MIEFLIILIKLKGKQIKKSVGIKNYPKITDYAPMKKIEKEKKFNGYFFDIRNSNSKIKKTKKYTPFVIFVFVSIFFIPEKYIHYINCN